MAARGVMPRTQESKMETLYEARWLAGKEIQRTWPSYLITAALALLFGVFAVFVLDALRTDPADGAGSAGLDIFFIFGVSAFTTNSLSRDYLRSWGGDTFSKRLHFLRSLPISAGEVVAGRVLTMLPALVLNSLAFFVVIYVASESYGGGLVEQLETGEYLAFVGIWVGYAVFCGGAWLYGELGLHGRTYNRIAFGVMALVLVLLVAAEWLLDARIVARTIGLAEEYGALPAILALLMGVVVFALWAMVVVRRIERRDLPL